MSADCSNISDDLVRQHIGLVRSVAGKIAYRSSCGCDYDDMLAVGMKGLAIAASRYDPSAGMFSTYAISYIRGYIQHYVRDNSRTIHIPRWVKDLDDKAAVVASLADIDDTFLGQHSCGPMDVQALDIHRVLDRLGKREREVVELRYVHGLIWRKVAERTGFTSGYGARLCAERALTRMRQLLGEDYLEGQS